MSTQPSSSSSGRERVVHAHRDRALVEVRHARRAVARLARERRAQAAAPRGLEHGVARVVRDACACAGRAGSPSTRAPTPIASRPGASSGTTKRSMNTLVGGDAERSRARPRPCPCTARARTRRSRRRACSADAAPRTLPAVEEAALGVEVMVHREPVAGLRAQAVRARRRRSPSRRLRFAYTSRIGRVVVASALLMIEITGVMPLPPANATIGTSRSCSTNSPVGRITSIVGARRERVVHPVRHAAAGDALHGGGERIAGVGRARHRVASARPPRRRSSPGTCRTARPRTRTRARARAGCRARTTGCRRSRRRRRPPRARWYSWSGSMAVPGRRLVPMITVLSRIR